jgi:hypothetical protein
MYANGNGTGSYRLRHSRSEISVFQPTYLPRRISAVRVSPIFRIDFEFSLPHFPSSHNRGTLSPDPENEVIHRVTLSIRRSQHVVISVSGLTENSPYPLLGISRRLLAKISLSEKNSHYL